MITEERRKYAQAALIKKLQDGDILYGMTHKTTSAGDIVQVLCVHDGRIEDLTIRIAMACRLRLCKLGIFVKGTGFSKIGAIAEEVNRVTGVKVKYDYLGTNQL